MTIPLETMQALAERGLTRREAAKELGCSYQGLGVAARRHGVTFRHASAGLNDADRADAMVSMYRGGHTLKAIGDLYGITRERVRQVIKKHAGISAQDGGATVTAARNKEMRRQRAEARCFEKNGCSRAQLETLRAIGRKMLAQGNGRERTPVGAFIRQKLSAQSRGIQWNFKLWDWWMVWQRSGKWKQRGRGADKFVMCRFGDTGPYEIGNVYIATLSHNSTLQPNNPYRLDHPDHDAAVAKIAQKRRASARNSTCDHHRTHQGLPRGVTRHRGKFQAQATLGGKNRYLGRFDTPQLAHAAYLDAIQEVSA